MCNKFIFDFINSIYSLLVKFKNFKLFSKTPIDADDYLHVS